MRLAHLSDPHFGTERPQVLAGLLRALEDLKPDVIVVSGDITQRALKRQYDAARRFIDALPAGAHRVMIPGNHDLPMLNPVRRFTAPYAAYEQRFGPRESLWTFEGVAFLALDATAPRRRKDGYLAPAHLQERLGAARQACGPDGLLLVVAHQPLWTAWGADKRQTLIDRAETARLFSDARTDIVFSGHVHVPFVGTSAASDPALGWRFVLCAAGTAISHRTRGKLAPNSFNVLDLDARNAALKVLRQDWDGAAFCLKEAFSFRRGATGWDPLTAPVP